MYQKVIDFGETKTISSTWWDSGISGSALNINNLIKAEGWKGNSSDCVYLPLGSNYIGANINFISLRPDGPSYVRYVLIQYTKTTDEAIAIGSDTDYSTTEKIVGTWIDGKPLYEKTIVGTSPSSIGDYATDLTNIDFCMLKDCIIQGGFGYSLNIAYQDNYVDIKTDGTSIYFYYPTGDNVFTNKPFFATIQYTKTTD